MIIKRKILITSVFGLFAILSLQNSYADENTLTRVKYTFEAPESANVEAMKSALKEAIKNSASSQVQEVNGFEPDSLPEQPGSVEFQKSGTGNASGSIFGGIMSNAIASNGQMIAMGAQFGDAIYGIKGYSSSGFRGVMGIGNNVTYEGYVGAIYHYKKGYRIYIFGIFNQQRDWLGKSTEWMVTQALSGGLPATYINVIHARDTFLSEYPGAQLTRQEPEWVSKYKSSGGIWNSVNEVNESPVKGQQKPSPTETPQIPNTEVGRIIQNNLKESSV